MKEWVLEGHGKQFRQNLVFGAWSCPEIQSLFDKECPNQRGLVMVSPSVQPGCLSDVMTPARFALFTFYNVPYYLFAKFTIFHEVILCIIL